MKAVKERITYHNEKRAISQFCALKKQFKWKGHSFLVLVILFLRDEIRNAEVSQNGSL